MYTVKEIAKCLGMSEHTVRYYTDKGLVPSLKRDKNGNRLFDEESKNWLIGVQNLRGAGMSIKSIKEYVDLCLKGEDTVEIRYAIILEQKKQLEAQLAEMNQRYHYMEQKVNMYLDIMNHHIPDSSNPAKWDDSNSRNKQGHCISNV